MYKNLINQALLASSLCSFVCADNLHTVRGSVFVSASTGISFFKVKSEASGTRTNNITLALGVGAGYLIWFNEYVGLRAYAQYNFNGFARYYRPFYVGNAFHDITINIDALYDFLHVHKLSFGAFLGIGIGYAIGQASNDSGFKFSDYIEGGRTYNGFILPINVGFSVGIGTSYHHRVEIGLKIPTTVPKVKLPSGHALSFRPNSLYLTYQFVF